MILVEVLVALFLTILVTTSFLVVMTKFREGSVRAEVLQGAVDCATGVVERIRGGLAPIPYGVVDGNCAAAGWPNLTYRVELLPRGSGSGNSGETWDAIRVMVFPATQHGQQGVAIYQLTTAASLPTR
ncbi:hypothetical protein JCM13210_09580 [Thermaerobacter litoralis]